MKRMIPVSLVGLVLLGSGGPRASAWWPWDSLFSNHQCCKQYNAFSPFCCEGPGGCCPMPCSGAGGSPACLFPDGQGFLGELPAPGVIAGPAVTAPATPPASVGSPRNSGPTVPRNNVQAIQPGMGPRPGPAWGGGMMNPPGVPGYYPGFMNYGPASGMGGPSYYPGFTGYG